MVQKKQPARTAQAGGYRARKKPAPVFGERAVRCGKAWGSGRCACGASRFGAGLVLGPGGLFDGAALDDERRLAVHDADVLVGVAGDGAVTLRFDRPVRILSVTDETVRVSRNGAALSGTLTPVDTGVAADGQLCATTFAFRLSGGALGSGNLSASYRDVVTYAGTASAGIGTAEVSGGLPFTGVDRSAYYCDSVSWAVNHEPQITAGTGGTFFSPEDPCTRAQAVTFLWRAMGQPEPAQKTSPFTDVRASDYFYKAVLWAVKQGITEGTGAAAFSPEEPCTRAQIVTFLYRDMA